MRVVNHVLYLGKTLVRYFADQTNGRLIAPSTENRRSQGHSFSFYSSLAKLILRFNCSLSRNRLLADGINYKMDLGRRR